MIHRILILVVVAGVACAEPGPVAPDAGVTPDLLSSASSSVSAVQHSVAGTLILAGSGVPDQAITPGGTYHLRDMPVFFNVVGDLEGTATLVQASNWTLPNGERCYFCGSLSGPATFDLNRFMGADVSAQLHGQVTAHVQDADATVSGKMVLHGSGDLDGVKVDLSFDGNLAPFGFAFAYEGTVLDPNGG